MARNQFASNRTWVRIPSSPPKTQSYQGFCPYDWAFLFTQGHIGVHDFRQELRCASRSALCPAESGYCPLHCRGDFELVIQMTVNIRRRADVAVTQPLLNVLEGNAVGQQQAGAAVTQIVKAHPAQAVVLQEFWECRGQIIGPHPLAQLVHKYKSIIFVIVTVAAY